MADERLEDKRPLRGVHRLLMITLERKSSSQVDCTGHISRLRRMLSVQEAGGRQIQFLYRAPISVMEF